MISPDILPTFPNYINNKCIKQEGRFCISFFVVSYCHLLLLAAVAVVDVAVVRSVIICFPTKNFKRNTV